MYVDENEKHFPKTYQLLRQSSASSSSSDTIVNAFLSCLEPQSHLYPHWGPWKGFIRYQLPIIVPENNVTFIRVANHVEHRHNIKIVDRLQLINVPETYVHYYKVGQGIMFDDSLLHDVYNNSTDEVRVVLFFDIVRKLPWFLDPFNRFVIWIFNHYNGKLAEMRRRSILPS